MYEISLQEDHLMIQGIHGNRRRRIDTTPYYLLITCLQYFRRVNAKQLLAYLYPMSSEYEEGAAGTEKKRKDDPLKEYGDKEPMTPAKEKEHEPTAVKREMSEKITEPGQTGTSPEEAAEIARKKGMAKGTAGAAETGSEYEQGAAGSNKQYTKNLQHGGDLEVPNGH